MTIELLTKRVFCRCARAALVCVIGLTNAADAGTLTVPGNFPTIRAAVNAAVNGDEIVIADGVYNGVNNSNKIGRAHV